MSHTQLLLWSIGAIALCTAGPAAAGTGDGWSLGVGTGLGVHSSASPDNDGHDGVVADLNVRGRFLWIVGLDVRLNLQDAAAYDTGDDKPQFAARYRTTLMLYPIPTEDFGIYLGGGIGATEAGDMLSVNADGNSYHAGLGIEWYASDLFAIDASFYTIIPGRASIERDVTRRATIEAANARAGADVDIPTGVPVGDYVSLSNFELMVRAMMVF